MSQHVNVIQNPAFKAEAMNKIANFSGGMLGVDTYYFKPGQVLDYHRHPEGDQVFFILQGEGEFYLDNGDGEEKLAVAAGSIVYVPAGTWHKLVNTGNGDLIASQATKAGAGMELRK